MVPALGVCRTSQIFVFVFLSYLYKLFLLQFQCKHFVTNNYKCHYKIVYTLDEKFKIM